jgi:outer membrane protein assembly factor BamB
MNLVGRFLMALSMVALFNLAAAAQDSPRLTAEVFNSNFADGHDTYNGLGVAADGKVYYVLCSEKYDVAGRMFCFDPATKSVKYLADLSEICGEKDMKAIAQGKIHCVFYEYQGKLYFSTHNGYYVTVDGMDVIGPPPPGWKPYQGGHFLSYEPSTGKFADLGIPLPGEGIIAMTMDTQRGRLYGLTWPHGHFVSYDVKTKTTKDLGPTSLEGEAGRGEKYRTICRSLAVDPTDGSVYFTTGDGAILRYD